MRKQVHILRNLTCITAIIFMSAAIVFIYGHNKPAQGSTPSKQDNSESKTPDTAFLPQAEVIRAEPETQTESLPDLKSMNAGTVVAGSYMSQMAPRDYFFKQEISDQIFERIYGKSFKENCTIPRTDLSYVKVLHYGFDGETHIGEVIVNNKIADDIVEIFYELYQAKYPIEKMILIDSYNAEDEKSMVDNNTSGFNFRTISGSGNLSKHSLGMAIDINPLYNPYVKMINGQQVVEPANAIPYTDRNQEFLYKITKDDLSYKLFTERGFTWGGSWNSLKDYQHFEKSAE